MIKLSSKTKEILDFLTKWQNEKRIFDLEYGNSMYFCECEEEDVDIIANGYFGCDLSKYFQDKFYGFGIDGAGGYYALWFYPNLDREPPVVMLDSEGQLEILASNTEEFLSRLVNNIFFWDNKNYNEEYEETENKYDDLIDAYEETFDKEVSEEEFIVLIEEERKILFDRASEFIEIKPDDEILKNFNLHPDIKKWVDEVSKKAI